MRLRSPVALERFAEALLHHPFGKKILVICLDERDKVIGVDALLEVVLFVKVLKDGSLLNRIVLLEKVVDKRARKFDSFERETVTVSRLSFALMHPQHFKDHVPQEVRLVDEVHLSHVWNEVVGDDFESVRHRFAFGESGDVLERHLLTKDM